MKVTRLQRGNRITLTDGELEALQHFVALGVDAETDGQRDSLSLAGRRGAAKIITPDALAVQSDRRKEK